MEFLSLARPTLVFLQGSSDLPIQQQLPMLSNVPVKILQVGMWNGMWMSVPCVSLGQEFLVVHQER